MPELGEMDPVVELEMDYVHVDEITNKRGEAVEKRVHEMSQSETIPYNHMLLFVDQLNYDGTTYHVIDREFHFEKQRLVLHLESERYRGNHA